MRRMRNAFDGARLTGRTVAALLFAPVLLAGCNRLEGAVRARAASDFSCDESEVEVEEVSGTTYRASGCGKSNEYTCSPQSAAVGIGATLCVSDNANPSVAGGGVPAVPTPVAPAAPQFVPGDPPSGAGGFALGASEADTRRACEQAGHGYQVTASPHGTCDGLVAEVGAPARAELTFCAGTLCAVALVVDPVGGESLPRALAHWKAAVSEKYGPPTNADLKIPSSCNDDVTPCLVDGTGAIRYRWQWPSRQLIVVSPQFDAARHPHVRLSYELGAAKSPGL